MADLKTKKNDRSVDNYLESIEDPDRKKDCLKVHKMMQEITGKPGSMWGDSIVGYGSYHYRYASGREGDWMLAGFSNRKKSISLYIMTGFSQYEELLKELGKHKTGKSCLYINRFDDIDEDVLRNMISSSVAYMKENYETR
jgi:hypothetical protein